MMPDADQQFLEVPDAYYGQVFAWIRWSSLAGAVGFGCAAVVWKQYEVPLVIVPLIMAAVGGAVIGWLGASKRRPDVLREFSSNFWVKIMVEGERNITELDLFEKLVPDLCERRKIHRMRTTLGEIYVLNADRFVELLVSRSMDELNLAVEHALGVAWNRSCGASRPEMQRLLSKNFREAFKGDLSGNVVKLISKVGEKVTRELAAEAEPIREDAETFKLESISGKPPRKGRKRAT